MSRLKSIGRYSIEGETLGKGNFAVVELATHTVSNSKVAVKVIDLRKVKDDYVRRNLYREAKVLSQLRHPNIIRLYETIKSTSLYCLVTEYAAGGDLLSLVRRQRGGRLTEVSARPYVRQLVSALHHMHERRVVHRDLKMENIMLDAKHKNIKIVGQKLQTHCGSADYAAPELFVSGQDYGPEVDIWSMGICIYAMVTGHLPFTTPHSENRRLHLLHQIQFGLGPRHETSLQHASTDCQELLKACIEANPELRIPLLDIELHTWLTNKGNELFKPYRQLPKDTDANTQVIEKMSEHLKLTTGQITQCVHDYRLDEYSAIYNIMLDEQLNKKGCYDGDHTLRKPTVHHTVLTQNNTKANHTKDSREIISRPRTPAVVGLVKYNNKALTKQPIDKLYFELAVLNNRETQRRPRTAICPPTGNKTKPIGNATTVNNVIARNYNNTNDKKYQRPKTTATCHPSKTRTQSKTPRKQIWQHSTPITRNKTDATKRTQTHACPKPQATLAMLAAIDFSDDVGQDRTRTSEEGPVKVDETNHDVNENTTPSVLRPTFTNQFRVTPPPSSDIGVKKSVQFSKDAKTQKNEPINSKEMSVIYMNKTFKHGYQLSRTATMYDQSENTANVQFNEFKPKLAIKLKETHGGGSRPTRDTSVEDFDRETSSSRSSTPNTPVDKISRPPTKHHLQAPTVVSVKPGSTEMNCTCDQKYIPVTTQNRLQSPMPQRICWKKRAGSANESAKKDENKIKIMVSRNNVHQAIPERDIDVISHNSNIGNNSPRRPSIVKHPPPSRSKAFVKSTKTNKQDNMNKYTDHDASGCSLVACSESQKADNISPGLKMFQLLRDATPCSCGETANMCSHKQESLNQQVDRMKQSYRDQLSSKRKTQSSPKVLSKEAVNMLRTFGKVKNNPHIHSRSRMKYTQVNLVTIVTKPPILKTNEKKINFEIERTQVGNKDESNKDETQLNNLAMFGFELERKISNAFKEGHVISKMRRTPDSFALLSDDKIMV